MMKLKHVDTIILVSDMQCSRAFYEGILGLQVKQDWNVMVIYESHLAIMQADELQPKEKVNGVIKQGDQGCGNAIIYLQSENLDLCLKDLIDRNIKIIHEIEKLPHERIIRIYDPDKHIIEIGEEHK